LPWAVSRHAVKAWPTNELLGAIESTQRYAALCSPDHAALFLGGGTREDIRCLKNKIMSVFKKDLICWFEFIVRLKATSVYQEAGFTRNRYGGRTGVKLWEQNECLWGSSSPKMCRAFRLSESARTSIKWQCPRSKPFLGFREGLVSRNGTFSIQVDVKKSSLILARYIREIWIKFALFRFLAFRILELRPTQRVSGSPYSL